MIRSQSAVRVVTQLHRVPAVVKLVTLIGFTFLVVALPREWFGAYAALLAILIVLIAASRIRPGDVARRLMIDAPFVGFAVLMPFIATGPRTEVAGLQLSVAGLWAAWALLSKATLCILAAILVAATTDPRRIILALEALRLPRELTMIMSFMLRYLDLIAEESARMRVARLARGFRARSVRSWRVLGRSVAALFIRAHGRGERVHIARLSRGLGQTS